MLAWLAGEFRGEDSPVTRVSAQDLNSRGSALCRLKGAPLPLLFRSVRNGALVKEKEGGEDTGWERIIGCPASGLKFRGLTPNLGDR